MAAFVKSIEKFSLTIAAGNGTESGTLTKLQTTANCVPFLSVRCSTVPSPTDDHGAFCVDAYFSGSTVVVETGTTATRVMVAEVTVVEFDSVLINVQQGAYSFTSTASSDTVTIDAVDEGNTFLYHTWQASGTNDSAGEYHIRGRLDSTTEANFQRGRNTVTTIDGHFYVVEALSGEFTVQPITIAMTGTQQLATIPTTLADLSKTMWVGSYKSSVNNNDNASNTGDCFINSTTQATFNRHGSLNDLQGEWYAVEFAGDEFVQRGTLVVTTGAASHPVNLGTPVTEANAMVRGTGHTNSFTGGEFDGIGSDDPPAAPAAWTFVDSDTIQMDHNTSGDADLYNVSWEVIEWDVAGGAPPATRRVMVIS